MFNQEEIRKVHASQIDSFLRLSQISFGGIERIVRLQLDMSRQSLDDQGKLVGELVKQQGAFGDAAADALGLDLIG